MLQKTMIALPSFGRGRTLEFLESEVRPVSKLTRRQVQKILDKNLAKDRPSMRVSQLAYECLDLKGAIKFQAKAYRVHKKKYEAEITDLKSEIVRLEAHIVEAEREIRAPKKRIKKRVQEVFERLLEELE